MKKIFLFLTYAVFFAGCSNDAPFTPPPAKNTLSVTLSDITTSSAKMTVEPSSEFTAYLNNIIEESVFEKHHGSSIETFVQNFLSDKNYWGEKTTAEIVSEITVTGKSSYEPADLKPATEYIAFAVGLAEDGSLTTDPVSKKFTTLKVVADITFEVKVLKQEWDNVDFEVIPSNDEDAYYFNIKPLSFTQSHTNEELLKIVMEEDAFVINYFYNTGTTSIVRVEGETPFTYYNPDTGYELLVFGYDPATRTASTGLSRFELRTAKPAGDPAACTFQVNLTDLKARSVTVAISPSDPQQTYAWDLIDADNYKTYKSRMKDFVAAYIDEIGMDNLEDDIRTYGEDGTIYNEALMPNSTYYVWAVCMDENGKPTADVFTSESFTTPEAVISRAKVDVTLEKYFDGDEVYSLDPATYADSKGMACVSLTFTASNDAKSWYGSLFKGDLSDSSEYDDDTVISTLRGGFEYAYPTGKLYNCEWNTPYTVLAFAQDAAGDYGAVYRKVYTFEKKGAAPISEFVAPEAAPRPSSFPPLSDIKPARRKGYSLR